VAAEGASPRRVAGELPVAAPGDVVTAGERPTVVSGGAAPAGADRDGTARLRERVVSRTSQWQGNIFSVETLDVELSDGSHGYREVVRHHGGAAVCAVRDGRICLVRQYRVALGCATLEIPAGKIEGDEDPAVCAARELGEETGLVARELTLLARSNGSPGFTDEMTHIYLAHGLSRHEAHPDEGEFVDVAWMPLADALGEVRRGAITDAKTIIAILSVAG